MVAAEGGQISRLSAGEGMNRLVGVTHHTDVLAVAQPQFQHGALNRTDVLVFVHDEVPVLVADLVGDLGMLMQQGYRTQQDVVEIDDPLVLLHLLVAHQNRRDLVGIQPSDLAPGLRGEVAVSIGWHVRDLRPADLGRKVTQQRRLDADRHGTRSFRNDAEVAVGHRWQLDAIDPRPEVADLAQCGSMEGARLYSRHAELGQSAAQLGGRLAGEGDRQGAPGLQHPTGRTVGDPVRDGPGLAGPCACEHHDGTPEAGRHSPLLRVQILQDARCQRCFGTHADSL